MLKKALVSTLMSLIMVVTIVCPLSVFAVSTGDPPTPWLYQLDIYRVESFDTELPDGTLTNRVGYDDFTMNSASSGSLPPLNDSNTASDYHSRNYIRVYVRKLGYTTSNVVVKLNGKLPLTSYSVRTYTSGTKVVGDDIVYFFFNIDEMESSANIELTNVFSTTTTGIKTITRNVSLTFEPSSVAAPTNVGFNYDSNQDKMVLSGVDSTMEYKLKTDYPNTWHNCTDTPMYFNIPNSYTYYYVRYKATVQNERSNIAQAVLMNRPSLSSVSYNAGTEMISGLTTEMVMSINGSTYSPVTETTLDVSDMIDDLDTGETATVNVMIPATAARAPSTPRTFTLYPRVSSPGGVTYNPVTIALSGTSSAMEYRLSTASIWNSISSSTVNLKSLVSATEDQTIYVRYKATSTSAASEYVSFNIPMLLEGPDCTLNTDTETISGFVSGTNYQYTNIANPTATSTWYTLTPANGSFNITNQISSSSNTVFHIRKAETSTAPITNFTSIVLPKREAAPTEPVFNYTDADNYDEAVLEGISEAMEYRLSNAAEWQSVTDDTMVFEIPSSSVTYYVRTKATETEFASAYKSIILYARASAPSSSYNTTTEIVTGLSTAMELSIDGGEYEQSSGTSLNISDLVDDIEAGETLEIRVRNAATATRPASAVRILNIYPRLAAPAGVTYNPVTIALNGTSSAMQYKLSTATSWTSISATSVNLKSLVSSTDDVSVQIRNKPTSTASASQSLNFTIPQLLSGPECDIDFLDQSVSGLTDGVAYQYYIGTNPSVTSSWTNLTVVNGKFDLTSLITTSNRTLNIRKAETSTTPLSNYTTLTVNAKPAAPANLTFVYNDSDNYDKAVLSGVNNTMEFRASNTTQWTPVSDSNRVFDIPTSSIVYYVRYKSNDTAFASGEASFYLYSRSYAPSISYNTTTEIISGLTSAREISINDGDFNTISSSTMDISEMINDIGVDETLIIKGRTAATQTAPASSMVTITVKPRANSPINVTYNSAAIALSGTATSMQYKLSTASSWTTATANNLNLKSFASQSADTIILLRYTPTNNNSASLPVQFTIPQLLAGPVCSVDYVNESINGLNDDFSYQYIIGSNPGITASWINASVSNGKFNFSNLLTTSVRVINLRKAETETSPVTHYTTLTLPARTAAPTTPVFTYNNPSQPGKAVLSGVNNTMEYALSTSSTWTSVPSDGIVFDIPSSSQTYYVRYKSTETTVASLNRALTLYTSYSAPGSVYNTSTESLSGLSTTYEISLNGENYTSCTSGTMSMTEFINDNTPNSNLVVNIRVAATSTQPASLIKTITIYPRRSAPSSATYNAAAIALNNTASGMEYRLLSSTYWTAINTSTVDLKQLVNTTNDVTIELRYAPSSTNSASLPVTITIPHLLSGPDGYLDYANESISGLDTDRQYQYYIGLSPAPYSTWLNATVADGKFDLSNIVTSSYIVTVNLRFAETATSPISNHTTYSVSGRPAPPYNISFIYNNTMYPGQAVLSGATANMEWRLSTDSTWTSINSLDTVFDLPNSNSYYYIRLKPTASSLGSLNSTVLLYAAGSGPSSYYYAPTESIVGVGTNVEIDINNSGYTDITSTSYPLSDLLSQMAIGDTITVKLRFKATASSPASQVTTLTITKS
jgi:hypothetical protein